MNGHRQPVALCEEAQRALCDLRRCLLDSHMGDAFDLTERAAEALRDVRSMLVQGGRR